MLIYFAMIMITVEDGGFRYKSIAQSACLLLDRDLRLVDARITFEDAELSACSQQL